MSMSTYVVKETTNWGLNDFIIRLYCAVRCVGLLPVIQSVIYLCQTSTAVFLLWLALYRYVFVSAPFIVKPLTGISGDTKFVSKDYVL